MCENIFFCPVSHLVGLELDISKLNNFSDFFLQIAQSNFSDAVCSRSTPPFLFMYRCIYHLVRQTRQVESKQSASRERTTFISSSSFSFRPDRKSCFLISDFQGKKTLVQKQKFGLFLVNFSEISKVQQCVEIQFPEKYIYISVLIIIIIIRL